MALTVYIMVNIECPQCHRSLPVKIETLIVIKEPMPADPMSLPLYSSSSMSSSSSSPSSLPATQASQVRLAALGLR